MDETIVFYFERLGIALLLGLLVGLQRQQTPSPLAGVRTFPLVTVFGALSAAIDQRSSASGVVIAASLLAIVATAHTTLVLRRQRPDPRHGMTTFAAVLLMFGVGAYLMLGPRVVAIAVGVVIAVLLQFKPELHGVASRLGDEDMRAIMQFALFTGVVLPVLPNQGYGPLGVLNPFNIWLMVVLIVGISVGGYIIYKFFGRSAGILLGGVLGGVISSTATTVSYARRSAGASNTDAMAAVVVIIASSVTFVRVLIEVAMVSPGDLIQLGTPVLIMFMACAGGALVVWRLLKNHGHEMPPHGNPTELRSALLFGGLYALVLLALAAAEHHLGGRGLYAVAVLSGLTDMDAITLSTANMVSGKSMSAAVGWRLLVVASMANLVFKCGLVAVMGSPGLLWRTAILFAAPLASGALLLLLWE